MGVMKIKDGERGEEEWIDSCWGGVGGGDGDWWVNKEREVNDRFSKRNVDNV